jgi:hypothetical protein
LFIFENNEDLLILRAWERQVVAVKRIMALHAFG